MLILFTIYSPGPAAGGPGSAHFKDLHKPANFGYHLPIVCSAAAPAPEGGRPHNAWMGVSPPYRGRSCAPRDGPTVLTRFVAISRPCFGATMATTGATINGNQAEPTESYRERTAAAAGFSENNIF